MTTAPLPRILILLAAHNGAEFFEEQLNTVLAQRDVDVTVLISDDASTDATQGLIAARTAGDARVRALPHGTFGSAAANFVRLIRDADPTGFDAIGFCDQDDRWMPWKLARHMELLRLPTGLDGRGQYDAVSSNVTAFTRQGKRQLIVKNQAQRRLDYAFESGGPGSTFLLRPAAFKLVQDELRRPDSVASQTRAHDWLVYALVRAAGFRWWIDGESSVEYRQHDDNVLGANEGLRSHVQRLQRIADGSFREDVMATTRAALLVATQTESARLGWLLERCAGGYLDQLRLARRVGELRRRRRDQLALAVALILGIW